MTEEQESLNNYEINERKLADELFKLIPTIESVEYTQGRICYDCLIKMKNQKTVLGEIKVRNIEINKYPDYILEVSKLISLINKYKKLGSDRIYYINFFSNKIEGIKDFIVFDLTARMKVWKENKPKIYKKYMNKVTYISNEKVCKEVIMLQYDEKIDMKGIMNCN